MDISNAGTIIHAGMGREEIFQLKNQKAPGIAYLKNLANVSQNVTVATTSDPLGDPLVPPVWVTSSTETIAGYALKMITLPTAGSNIRFTVNVESTRVEVISCTPITFVRHNPD